MMRTITNTANTVTRGAGEVLETVHSAFTCLTLALVALHILGVVASSFAHRANLVRAMFTGKKTPKA